MPTVPNPLSELGILPLAAKAIKEFRARDEVRTLLSFVDADIRSSDLLPPGAADEVIERLHGLLVQPEIAGALARWIDIGDKRVHEPLERRLAQLLVFDGIDSKQLAALVAGSVEKNVTRAKRSDREALLLEGRLTRADIGELKGELAEVASRSRDRERFRSGLRQRRTMETSTRCSAARWHRSQRSPRAS